ncbi:conserved protein of unknown function (plasmid) [Rhodovastum atsumiense]|uniref:S1 family peptidase n=1 Tax=Rhodovastum atsumiense TaxID=504468 RepID=UPI0020259697|nr:serine protease [Rhodovastum atsumiense]CAH2605601.1 conserved protein of unknown function [Rhodovastum atsumiense]
MVWSVLGALAGSALLAGGLLTGEVAGAVPQPAVPEAPPVRHSAGSGFAVAPGLVVTNAHLVLRCRQADLPLVEVGRRGAWRVVYEDPDLDLALLAPPAGGALPSLRLSAARHLAPGAAVMLLGYPGGETLASLVGTPGRIAGATLTVHRPETGRVASLQTRDASGREVTPTWADGVAWFGADNAARLRWVVQITAGTGPGGSGGPVMDGAGAVVGVVFAGQAGGPTYAVPLADLVGFLVRAGFVPDFAPPYEGTPNWPMVQDAAAGSMVRLAC